MILDGCHEGKHTPRLSEVKCPKCGAWVDVFIMMGGRPGQPGSNNSQDTTTEEASTSMKGLKAANSMLISGGSITINSADDAIHSDVSLTINGGTFIIASGDDAIHAEDTLTVTAGKILVAGTGVGDVGSVVLRDRKHLAMDGMIVVCVNLSSEDGSILSGPDIISRGFVQVKDNEDLMEAMRMVAGHALETCQDRNISDWATIKSTIKNELGQFIYRNTKKNPMILPIIMEI